MKRLIFKNHSTFELIRGLGLEEYGFIPRKNEVIVFDSLTYIVDNIYYNYDKREITIYIKTTLT